MQAIAPLIDRIENFLSRTGMTATVFGREAMGDPAFVFKLRKGRRVWPETAERVDAFMGRHRGEKAA